MMSVFTSHAKIAAGMHPGGLDSFGGKFVSPVECCSRHSVAAVPVVSRYFLLCQAGEDVFALLRVAHPLNPGASAIVLFSISGRNRWRSRPTNGIKMKTV